jgi:hypothetical protein
MLQRWLASVKALFRPTPQKPLKAYITPRWVEEGRQAALALSPIPADEFSQVKALESAFQAFYSDHLKACKQANLPEAYQQFKQGWLMIVKSKELG